MGSYELLIKRSAAKELEALPTRVRHRIVAKIEDLASSPRPPGVDKLSGETKYRLRQGDYRVLSLLEDGEQIVRVVNIAHRREVYR